MRAGNALTLGTDRALYTGEIPATGWHHHAAPVLLLGLSGRFALHWAPDHTTTCQSALIAAGVEHVFDPTGEQVALVYLEPDAPESRGWQSLFRQHGGVLLDVARPTGVRHLTQGRLDAFDLPAVLKLPHTPPGAVLDPRIAGAVQALRTPHPAPWARGLLAQQAQLSSSRFNHLFRAEMGVSFRSYRVWSQVRLAMASLATQPRLVDAALDGAFSDSAHFSRMFRQTFGMTPSSVIRPLRTVSLIRP